MKTTTLKILRVGIPALSGLGVLGAVVFAHTLGTGHRGRHATIPAGTTFVVALDDEVSTTKSDPGDEVVAHTVATIQLDDGAVIPQGVRLRGTVTESKGGGRVAGASQLAMKFIELEVDGDREEIHTEAFRLHGRNDAAQSAAEIGGGAVAGGILGRVLGGKGGTVPGAVVGAAIGTGVAVATEGSQIVLHKGQQLRIRLEEPVTVTYSPHPELDDSAR